MKGQTAEKSINMYKMMVKIALKFGEIFIEYHSKNIYNMIYHK